MSFKSDKNNGYYTAMFYPHLRYYPAEFFLEQEFFPAKFADKIKRHILCSLPVSVQFVVAF